MSAAAALALLPAALTLAAHTGWLAPRRCWQRATGWSRLDAPPPPSRRFTLGEHELKLLWLGHAGFLLEWRDTRVLLDPHLGDRCTVARRRLAPAVTPGALGAVDAALISHAHFDHLHLPTLRGVPRLDAVLLPAGGERHLHALGRRDTALLAVRAGDRVRVGSLEVTAVPAAHNGHRHHPFAAATGALGYVLHAAGEAVYFAGDTSARLDFTRIRNAWAPRLAILPIGAYSPRWPLRGYHLSPEEAVAASRALGVEVVVPCHFGTFTLSLDRPADALPRFARAARAAGVRWAMPCLLAAAGESDSGDGNGGAPR